MKHYLSLHLESARNAARHFIRQPLATLLILLMLAIAMTLPLALYLGVQSGQAVLGKLLAKVVIHLKSVSVPLCNARGAIKLGG